MELPSDFPTLTPVLNQPSFGYLFLSAFSQAKTSKGNYLMILDDSLHVVKFKKTSGNGIDFKKQSNGLYSYCQFFNGAALATKYHYVLDRNLDSIGSVS